MGFLNTARLVAASSLIGAISTPVLAAVATPGVYDFTFTAGSIGYMTGPNGEQTPLPGHSGTATLWVGQGGVVNYASGLIDGARVGVAPLGVTLTDPNAFNPTPNDNVLLSGPTFTSAGLSLLLDRPSNYIFNFYDYGLGPVLETLPIKDEGYSGTLDSYSFVQRPGTVYDFSFNASGTVDMPITYDGSGRFLVNDGVITAATGAVNGQQIAIGAVGSFFENDNVFSPAAPYFTTNGLALDVPSTDNTIYIYSWLGENNIGSRDVLNFDQPLPNIRVTQVGAAVPEPGTWALMLVGFGAIGFSMRRRRAGTFLPQVA